jgi:8-oxo-dGTP pyrophosphatase MutT (NUDIX family)
MARKIILNPIIYLVLSRIVPKLSGFTLHKTSAKSFASATIITPATVQPMSGEPVEISKKQEPNGSQNSLSFPKEALQFDTYKGITIHVSKLPDHYFDKRDDGPNLFERTLRESLALWKEQMYRGIWLHIPTHLSPSTLPICIQELNFDFRYAHPGVVIIATWLPDPEIQKNKLPWGPTHQVGVGAVIVHPRNPNKILVVQEKSGPAAVNQLWKMPTGLTDPGEDVPEALIREVQEETGLHVSFQHIICIRQAHSSGRSSGGSLGHSDLFFVCLATFSHHQSADDESILHSIQLNQEHDEIANIQWMDVDEYADQKLWRLSPLYQEMNDAVRRCVYNRSRSYNSECVTKQTDAFCDLTVGKSETVDSALHLSGFIAKTLPIGFRPGVNTIYVSKL